MSLESVDSARTLYEFWEKCGFCEDLVEVLNPGKYGFCQDLARIRGSSRTLALGGASCATVLGFWHLGANPVRQYYDSGTWGAACATVLRFWHMEAHPVRQY